MSHPNGQNPYGGYQQPPQQYGGYPQQPHQHGGYPMAHNAGPPMPPPPDTTKRGRRGGSRALPIIVAAGLAVGVFGGLMIVRGTGESKAATQENTEENGKGVMADAGAVAAVVDAGTPEVAADAAVAAAVTADAAEPAKPETRPVTVTFDVDPPGAKIRISGKPIDGTTYTFDLIEGQEQKLKIRASAPGYRGKSLQPRVKGDETIKIQLKKKKKKPSGGGSGGLIDL